MTTKRLAKDIMSRNVITVPDDLPISELVRTLAHAHISGAPVLNHKGLLCGVVSTTDIVSNEIHVRPRERDDLAEANYYGRPDLGSHGDIARLGLHVEDYGETLVRDIMMPIVISAGPDASIADIASLMRLNRIHRVLIVDDQQLVGIVSALDLVGLIPAATLSTRSKRSEILLATDLGPTAMEVCRFASQLAIERDAKLVALHVTPHVRALLDAYGDRADLADLQQQFEETAMQLLDQMRTSLGDIDQNLEVLGMSGDPAELITRVAAERKPEVLVIGAKRSAGARLPGLGSVAERVLAAADVPVLLVPHREP